MNNTSSGENLLVLNSEQVITPSTSSSSPNPTIPTKNQELPPAYNIEFVRLKSFPYSWGHPVTKRELARNGFYYKNEEISKCYCCNLEIQQHEITTSISLTSLHRELKSDCDFAHERPTVPLPNVPLEDTSDLRYERNRLISFLGANWYHEQVDPEDLAKWGFYWTGVADVGRCFFCRLEVRGWEPSYVAHNTLNTEELGVMLSAPPRYPDYASLSSRRGSYSMWPLSMNQRPEQLTEAGFYYTGKGDRLICFQCGGGLKDWGHTDLPWVEHAVWFPRCAYLLMKKGREFVSQVQALKNAQLSNTNSQATPRSSITSHQPSVPQQPLTSMQPATLGHHPANLTPDTVALLPSLTSTPPAQDDAASNAASMEVNEGPEGNSEASNTRLCKVCLQNELGIVFLPCGHMTTCPDCAPQLTCCPICRAKINAYVRAFLP